MSSDWKECSVVRDGKGRLRTGDGRIYAWSVGEGLSEEAAAAYEHALGPFTPVLDADGLPVVTTVGDLTARHIGRRVRLDEHYDAKLETIFAHEGGEVSLNFTHPEGFAFGCSRSLDTPCEVIG